MKRKRRSKAEMERIRVGLYEILHPMHPQTVRQVFYQAVSQGLVEKTEQAYKGTVVRLLAEMRYQGQIPYQWIADYTRWMRKPTTYSSLAQAVEHWKQAYRRELWLDQPVDVEIWLEKDALAGVIIEETRVFDVPLMVTRGYSSISFLHTAACEIEASHKPTYLYLLGDYDPSGQDAMRNTIEKLQTFAPKAEIYFGKLAVTPNQIQDWSLPTRPTKATDSRARNFSEFSVELDAIAANELRALVRSAIEQHIDREILDKTRLAESSEKKILQLLGADLRGKLTVGEGDD